MPQKYKSGKDMITGHKIALSDSPFVLNDNELKTPALPNFADDPISPKDVAEYSEELLAQIRDLASAAGLTFLAYLVQVAVEEARIQAGKQDEQPS
jgi:hypothetical protein